MNHEHLELAIITERWVNDGHWGTKSRDAEVEDFASTMERFADKCMPRRSVNPKRPPVFWWTEEISELRKECIKRRRIYLRKRKKNGGIECDLEAGRYKDSRKELAMSIKTAKDKCWRELCEEVNRDPWGRPYKLVLKKLTRTPITGIEIPGRIQSIVKTLFPVDETEWTRERPERGEQSLEYPRITESEVLEEAKRIPNGKAPGPDGITNELLKEVIRQYPERLTYIYNRCIREVHYPGKWKVANLVLMSKPGKQTDDPSAYRPLCMLDTVGKLFEKLLARRLTKHIDDTGALEEAQYGFRQRKSTVTAIKKLQDIVKETNQRGDVVGMLAIDVKNAFNSARWVRIREALSNINVPVYLQGIIGAYLTNREIRYNMNNNPITFSVNRGVPQGSVLGPLLWNVMYNDLLRIDLPSGVEMIAFADDIAIIARSEHPNFLEEILEESFARVKSWMQENGLELAEQKTEAIVFTGRYSRNKMSVRCGESIIESKKSVKYLGLVMDQKLLFRDHATETSRKTMDIIRKLGYILPNIGGARESRRKLLATTAMSRVLYGAPCWSTSMGEAGWKKLEAIQRRISIQVAAAYKTVSYAAISVLASMPPLRLKAEELMNGFNKGDKSAARKVTLNKWQEYWDTTDKGHWTHRLIPNIAVWTNRKHGEITFHLTQILTGHGSFGEYLYRFKRRNTDECQLCGRSPDTPNHAVFECDAWHMDRRELEFDIGVEITPDNVVRTMLHSKNQWIKVAAVIEKILRKREDIEREVERTS